MGRLKRQMEIWLESGVPTIVGGDFNVIPEDIDRHKPASWIHDALFQPEPRASIARCSGSIQLWGKETRKRTEAKRDRVASR
jgi:exonuclease III